MAKKDKPATKPPGYSPAQRSLEELVRSSGLIFSGTVAQRSASTVPILPPSDNLVVVRVDRGLRVDPVLGDLRGKMVTVETRTPGELKPEQQAIFFTQSLIHGRGIAVREVDRMGVGEEQSVAAVVSQLPQLHLQERLQSAEVVAEAEVVRISPVERTSFERNAALWTAAELKISKVLRGKPLKSAVVYFPTSDHPMWARAPRFKEHQRGIFILHGPSREASPSLAALGADSLVALDPEDFQPESQLNEVKKSLDMIK